MIPSAVLAACLAGDAHAQAPAPGPVQRYALLVGHNDGGAERATLRYAHADAHQMASVLTDIGGVAPQREWVLLDPDPAALRAAFDEVRATLDGARDRSEFVFYYSGHSDEEGLLLGDERFGYGDLRETLDGLPARVRLAILDSCASGALILSKGGRSVAPFLVDQSTQHAGFAYLTSSSADEVAQEAERIGGSYFTHFLTTGLRGAADSSGDGRVTLNEAYSYANARTLARTERTQHGPQHPRYETQLSGTGDYVLTDLALTSATMVLDAPLVGQAMIRDLGGALVAEVGKDAGRAIELGLPEGRYTVTLTGDAGGYGEAVIDVAAGSSALVAAADLVWRTSEATVARGDALVPIAGGAPIAAAGVSPRVPVGFQLVPGLPAAHGLGDTLLFGVGGAETEDLGVLGLSFGYVDVTGTSRGFAGAFGATLAGELAGVQGSFGANVVRGGGGGGQLTLGFNAVGDGFDGVQLASVNAVGGVMRGGQLSAVNVAAGGLRGLQLGAVNHAGGIGSEGVQLSGFNVAGGLSGLQLGLINVGRTVNGVQLGVINIAGRVSGTQIGLINVAKDVKGAPFGLVSVEKEGRHDVLVYWTETDPGNVELRFGGDYLYTVLGTGGLPDQAYLSFGLGVHAPMSRLWLDLDAVGAGYVALQSSVLRGGDLQGPFGQPPTGVLKARATLGLQLLPELAPFVGVGVNGRIPTDARTLDVAPAALTPEGQNGEELELVVWPSLFGGLQF